MDLNPSAGYRISITVRPAVEAVLLKDAITSSGGEVVEILNGSNESTVIADARDDLHQQELRRAITDLAEVEQVDVIDEVLRMHEGGKIAVVSSPVIADRDQLSMAYTPGVGRVSRAIADDVEQVWDLTIKSNAVAVLSNGTAVLGLGDIGPEAALPVMEGKAMLFKQFGDVDAYPICVDAPTADELVAVGKAIAPTFGGINLEDIAAPMCFEVEDRLREALDIPVFHDDQHGTAVVVVAAIENAAKVVGKNISDMRVVVMGAGAAGVASSKLMLQLGVGDVIVIDRIGTVSRNRADLNSTKQWLAENTNKENLTSGIEDALRGADVFVGVSGPDLVKATWIAEMANDAVVVAMANPVPEIMPEELPTNVTVVATGRSDYPNQINNALVFPGFFRGLLDARARKVTDKMKLEAAHALADLVGDDLGSQYIIPSPFDERVAPAVAAAVRRCV